MFIGGFCTRAIIAIVDKIGESAGAYESYNVESKILFPAIEDAINGQAEGVELVSIIQGCMVRNATDAGNEEIGKNHLNNDDLNTIFQNTSR